MRRLLVVLAAASLIGVFLAPTAASAQKAHVFLPNAHPVGASYGDWQARWFEWFIEIPAPVSPLFDETGELCGTNQSGPVWFLAPVAHPGTTTRACTVPTGTGVFVQGLGNECSNVEPPPFFGATEAELRAAGRTDLTILRWPLAENDRLIAEGRAEGLVKLVADGKGRLLGASLVGPGVGDMAGIFVLMIGRRLPLSVLAGVVLAYPTAQEAAKRAASELYTPKLL